MLNNYLNSLKENDCIKNYNYNLLNNRKTATDDEWDFNSLSRTQNLKFLVLNLFAGMGDGLIGAAQTGYALVTGGRGLNKRVTNYALSSLWHSGHTLRYSFINLLNVIDPKLNVEIPDARCGVVSPLFLSLIEKIAQALCDPKRGSRMSKQIMPRFAAAAALVALVAGRSLDALLALPAAPLALVGACVTALSGYEFTHLNEVTCRLLEFPTVIHDIVLYCHQIINPTPIDSIQPITDF